MRSSSIKQSGFTLVEVLIIAPVVILFIGLFIGFIVSLTGESLMTREHNTAIYDVQGALNDIEAAASQATTFLTKTDTDVPAPQGKDNATNAAFTNTTSGQPDALIMRSAATSKNPYDSSRSLIYTGSGACNAANPVYTYYTVFFVSQDTDTSDPSDMALYRRTILPQVATCLASWQRGSCAASAMANTTICKTRDEKLAAWVTGFTVSYYSGTSAVAKTAAASATDISVTLSVSRQVAGETISYTASSQQINSANIQGP